MIKMTVRKAARKRVTRGEKMVKQEKWETKYVLREKISFFFV
jgi:hypothetical protein